MMIFEVGNAIQVHWQKDLQSTAVRREDVGGTILNKTEGERQEIWDKSQGFCSG